ncbi:MAG: histidine phosphatase family protein [Halochromatium sp.]|nr:histidine phosphatase family protein [Halochromatium sp.]
MPNLPTLMLVRHGETEWSRTHRHTGRTDLPLEPAGEQEARATARPLASLKPALVLSSPLLRARETASLAGFGPEAGIDLQLDADLMEWDYGDYEGRTTASIHAERPGWLLFRDGCPNGEDATQVGARADRVVARARSVDADVLLFSHGHFCRVLAARWLGLPADHGRYLSLSTAAISVLGYEHSRDEPTILRWNDEHHLTAGSA